MANEKNKSRTSPPARSLEARENQLISLAVDLAEKQLRDGTASSQVITHYLKMGSTKERLEKEKLEQENKVLKAKAEAYESSKQTAELYKNALDAMRKYTGNSSEESYDS